MKFRPCIDIHNGKVKQIVGGTLKDAGDQAKENFVSQMDAADYARLYQARGLTGGHVIMLNGAQSPYYKETRQQAINALSAYSGGLMVGGGITPQNAGVYLSAGASHVIVTSYVFCGGRIDRGRLKKMRDAVGRAHLVLDVSCRKRDGQYYVVTDRWQTFTEQQVTEALLDELYAYCDEFLIHGVDVEGSASGIEEPLVSLLGGWGNCPVTYAGGIGCEEDLRRLEVLGQGRLDFTVGSALDLFGGTMSFEKLTEKQELDKMIPRVKST